MEQVEALINNGANVNIPNQYGDYALHIAALFGTSTKFSFSFFCRN